MIRQIGVILGILKKCNKLGECCFRCTWCQNMFIGATIMLIFSFFGIISVGWADFCVNLDRFEADPKGSQLGQTIAQFSVNYSGNDSMALNPVDIVNACWTGSDLLGVFDLKDTMNWDSFRDNLTDVINIDITKEFTLDTLDSFICTKWDCQCHAKGITNLK